MDIFDTDAVLRRVLPGQCEEGKVTSMAFTPDEISVHLESVAVLTQIKQSHPNKLMVRLTVADIRAGGFDEIILDPTPEDPSHALVRRRKSEGYGRKTRKKRLKALAKLIKF